MRIVEKKMEYKTYDKILSAILLKMSYALVNSEYKNDTGYFFFWDESYIPEILKKEIKRPPTSHDPLVKLDKELTKIFEDEELNNKKL